MSSDKFKGRLKEAMGGESNRSFAVKCDISEMTLRRYLLGDTYPPLDTLEKIAEVSGRSLAWLASGEDTAKTPAAAVNEDLLVSVLEAVEEYLDQVDCHLPPAKKAQLVTALYDMCVEDDLKVADKAKVIRLVKLAA
jgi:transcriptional regulator with XRE-family HTH domain